MTLSVTTGSVSDLDNATDISAKSANVTVSNGSFGTSANAIVTSVDELTVSTAAQNGDIFVTETNGLSNLSLSAGTGNVTLTLNDGSVVDIRWLRRHQCQERECDGQQWRLWYGQQLDHALTACAAAARSDERRQRRSVH